MFNGFAAGYAHNETRLVAVAAELRAWHKSSEVAKRLTQIPGVGVVVSTMLVMKTPDPQAFGSGRGFAAWLGLTPKDHSTACKTRLGRITRAGDETLRSLLVVGATSVINVARRGTTSGSCRGWPACSRASRRSWPPSRWPIRSPASLGS